MNNCSVLTSPVASNVRFARVPPCAGLEPMAVLSRAAYRDREPPGGRLSRRPRRVRSAGGIFSHVSPLVSSSFRLSRLSWAGSWTARCHRSHWPSRRKPILWTCIAVREAMAGRSRGSICPVARSEVVRRSRRSAGRRAADEGGVAAAPPEAIDGELLRTPVGKRIVGLIERRHHRDLAGHGEVAAR